MSQIIFCSVLASLNLPAALEDVSGDNLPQSLADKAKAIRDQGGIEAIEKLINELPELLTRNKEILDEVLWSSFFSSSFEFRNNHKPCAFCT